MVEDYSRVDAVFHALSHDARRQMVSRLAAQELTVSQLAEPFSMSLAAASKHLQVLESAGLVRRQVRGREHLCSLDAGPLASAFAWLRDYEQLWAGEAERAAPVPPRRPASEWEED